MIKIIFKAKDNAIIAEIKQKFSKPSSDPTLYPSAYVLEDGTVVATNSKESSDYGYGKMEHNDFDKYLKDRGVNVNFEDCANVVRFMTRGLTVEIPPKELTPAQYQVLENWLKNVYAGFGEPKIGVGIRHETAYKVYDMNIHSLTYIMGRIKRYYGSGRLVDARGRLEK